MPVWLIILLIVLGLGLIFIIYIWSTYNSLVRTNERVDEAWSDITVQLKYRADLIPNLVETVKGYAKHESETLKEVIAACRERSLPIRVGVNAGSLEKDLLLKYGNSAKALAASALKSVLLPTFGSPTIPNFIFLHFSFIFRGFRVVQYQFSTNLIFNDIFRKHLYSFQSLYFIIKQALSQ